jgi:hypothetical protein
MKPYLTITLSPLAVLALACATPKPPQEPPHVETTASAPPAAQSPSQPIVATPAATGAPAEPPAVRHDGRG